MKALTSASGLTGAEEEEEEGGEGLPGLRLLPLGAAAEGGVERAMKERAAAFTLLPREAGAD